MIDSAMQPGAAQKAFSMHVESFWQRHSSKVIVLGAALLLYVLWCVICFAEPSGLTLKLRARASDLHCLSGEERDLHALISLVMQA